MGGLGIQSVSSVALATNGATPRPKFLIPETTSQNSIITLSGKEVADILLMRLDLVFYSGLTHAIMAKGDMGVQASTIDLLISSLVNSSKFDPNAIPRAISVATTPQDLLRRSANIGSAELPTVARIPATLPIIGRKLFGLNVDTYFLEGDMLLSGIAIENYSHEFFERIIQYMVLCKRYVRLAGNGSQLSARIAIEEVLSDQPLKLFYDGNYLVTAAGPANKLLASYESNTPINSPEATGLGFGPNIMRRFIDLGIDNRFRLVVPGLNLHSLTEATVEQDKEAKLQEIMRSKAEESLPSVSSSPVAFLKLQCSEEEIEERLAPVLNQLEGGVVEVVKANSYADGGVTLIASLHDGADIRNFMSALTDLVSEFENLRIAVGYGPLQKLSLGADDHRKGLDVLGEMVNRLARLIYSKDGTMKKGRIIVEQSMVEAHARAGGDFSQNGTEYSLEGAKGYAYPLVGRIFDPSVEVIVQNQTLRELEDLIKPHHIRLVEVERPGDEFNQSEYLEALREYRAVIIDFITKKLTELDFDRRHIQYLINTAITFCNLDRAFTGNPSLRALGKEPKEVQLYERMFESYRNIDLKKLAVAIVEQARFAEPSSALRIILGVLGEEAVKLTLPSILLDQVGISTKGIDKTNQFAGIRDALMKGSIICLGREFPMLRKTLMSCGVDNESIGELVRFGFAIERGQNIIIRAPLARIVDQRVVDNELRQQIHIAVAKIKAARLGDLFDPGDLEDAISLLLHGFNIDPEILPEIVYGSRYKIVTGMNAAFKKLWNAHRYESIATLGHARYKHIADNKADEYDLQIKYGIANIFLGNLIEANTVIQKLLLIENGEGMPLELVDTLDSLISFIQANSMVEERRNLKNYRIAKNGPQRKTLSYGKRKRRMLQESLNSQIETELIRKLRILETKSEDKNSRLYVLIIKQFILKYHPEILSAADNFDVVLARTEGLLPN